MWGKIKSKKGSAVDTLAIKSQLREFILNPRTQIYSGFVAALIACALLLMMATEATQSPPEVTRVKVGVPYKMATGEVSDPQKEASIVAARARDVSLTPAPLPELIEQTTGGLLPKIAVDGKKSWQAYARPPAPLDAIPKIAIVITDLGLSRATTELVITEMPGDVALIFDAQAPVLPEWIARARGDGHEILLSLPMEPQNFPRDDPGPRTLLTTQTDENNLSRLELLMAGATGYIGFTSQSGSRFLREQRRLDPIAKEIAARGLMWLDYGQAVSAMSNFAVPYALPYARVDFVVDRVLTEDAIHRALEDALQQARLKGSVIIASAPYPLAMRAITDWIDTLPRRNVQMVPLSHLVPVPKPILNPTDEP